MRCQSALAGVFLMVTVVGCGSDAAEPSGSGGNGGHLGILQSPHMERIRGATTAWLRWKLMRDTTLDAMFVGDQCTSCQDSYWWKVQQKNL